MALLDKAIVRMLPAVPRPVVRRLSQRYIAGPTLDEALDVVRALNASGKMATIDVLGEDVTSADVALKGLVHLLEALEDLDDVQHVYSNADIPDEILARV